MKVSLDIPNKGVCQLPQFVLHVLHHLFSLFPVPEGGQKSGHDNVPVAVLSVGEQRLHNKPNIVLVLRIITMAFPTITIKVEEVCGFHQRSAV